MKDEKRKKQQHSQLSTLISLNPLNSLNSQLSHLSQLSTLSTLNSLISQLSQLSTLSSLNFPISQLSHQPMIFKETRLKGAYIIELERLEDERGFFARTFCQEEFEKHGLNPRVAQCNISHNKKKGTLRGMHYQVAPHEEAKLVSCIRGAIYDVIIDLRPDSSTYCQWFAVELAALNSQLSTLN